MDEITIECPECGAKFNASEALSSHLKNTEKNYKLKLAEKEKEIEKTKIEEAKKAEISAAEKFKLKLAEKEKEIEKTKIEEAKKAEISAAEKFKLKLEAKDMEIEKIREKEEMKAQVEAEKKYKSILSQKEKESALKIKNEIATEFYEKIQRKDDELEKLKMNQKILTQRLEIKTVEADKKNEEIKKMIKQGSVELQGEVQEDRLHEYLAKTFPDDDVEDVSKGQKGGDCIQTINYDGKKNIGKIYFESKDTKKFSEEWTNKLLKDMNEKGISNGIIVCSLSCMPDDLTTEISYVERHGNYITIIPFIKPLIHAITNRIRSILIFKSRQNKDSDLPKIMKECFNIINSPNFTIPIKNMVADIKNMKDEIDKDKVSFNRSLIKRTKVVENIEEALRDMVLPLIDVDQNIFPENLLEPQEKLKKIRKGDSDIRG